MDIKIKLENKKTKYLVGDIIVINSGEIFFIYSDPSTGKYSLLNCKMDTWASGCFDSIDDLMENMKNWTTFQHYSANEYQLELVPTKEK
ncbi:hypothetical protein ACO11K_003641 [Bacillus cytotoxicus]|uniref:hypothetical protein n=1 Tax=Bacillus cereus group TaxID=86661 RepID=UPI001F597AD0|nr:MULTISPECIES: hypothetical protein [unclassified Bacillus cereus group]